MITSPRNPKVAEAASLKKRAIRDARRRYLVEGAQSLGEGLAVGGIEQVFALEGDAQGAAAAARGIPVEIVSEPVLERLASTVTPQGAVGVAGFRDLLPAALTSLEGPSCLALLSACRDPGNAGTVVRSALAAGAAGVMFADTSVDIYNPKTVRASAGALFRLPHVRQTSATEAIAGAKAAGYQVVAAAADGEESLFSARLSDRVLFVFGNEAWGLRPEVAAAADTTVHVPLAGGAESLNLAAAATVCLYEWRRRRDRAPGFDVLIAAAAHDLRSPAAAVKTLATTLLGRQLDAETTSMLLAGIAYDADRMGLIVQQLVEAARLAGGTMDAPEEPGDVAAIVRELTAAVRGDPDHPAIIWEGPEMLETPLGRTRLRVALAAQVELAVWFATDGPITVAVAGTDKDALELSVRRAGANLGTTTEDELFEVRAPGSGGGSKLGPFVAREAARASGGDLTASIDPDGALVLLFRQPLHRQPGR